MIIRGKARLARSFFFKFLLLLLHEQLLLPLPLPFLVLALEPFKPELFKQADLILAQRVVPLLVLHPSHPIKEWHVLLPLPGNVAVAVCLSERYKLTVSFEPRLSFFHSRRILELVSMVAASLGESVVGRARLSYSPF